MKTGSYVRSALISAIYSKSLRLSNKEFQTRSTGSITNHMAIDTEKVRSQSPSFSSVCLHVDASTSCSSYSPFLFHSSSALTSPSLPQIQMQALTFHNLWSAPARMVLGMALLYNAIGPAVFVGVGLVIIVTPLQILVMRKIAKEMKMNYTISDKRVKLMNEVLPGKSDNLPWICISTVVLIPASLSPVDLSFVLYLVPFFSFFLPTFIFLSFFLSLICILLFFHCFALPLFPVFLFLSSVFGHPRTLCVFLSSTIVSYQH